MDFRDILNQQLMAAAQGSPAPAPIDVPAPAVPAPQMQPIQEQPQGTTDRKQQSVLDKTQGKQEALLGRPIPQQQQQAEPNPEELAAAQRAVAVSRVKGIDTPRDGSLVDTLRNGQIPDLIDRLGVEGASAAIGGNADANAQALRESSATRTTGEAITDFGTSIVSGVVGGIGGTAALGSQILGASDASRLISEATSGATKWLGETQSRATQVHRNLEQEASAIREQQSNVQYELDRKEHGDMVAGLMKVGREASSAINAQLENPMLMSDGTGQAVGSILTSGGIGKVITAGAQKLAPKLLKAEADKLVAAHMAKAGVTAETAVMRNAANKAVLKKLEENVTVPLGIGTIEAGGAYQQTFEEVMGMKHDALMKNSEDYRKLIQEGKTPDAAKQELAQTAGLKVAGLMFPLAIAAGRLVSPFERAPFSPGSLKAAAINVLAREPIEEAIQGGVSQASMNLVLQNGIDPDRNILDGVGAAVGTGALYGSMGAGVMQGPGGAVRGTVGAVGAVAGGASKLTSSVANNRTARNEAVQQERQNQAVSEMQDTASNTVMPTIDSMVSPENTTLNEEQKQRVGNLRNTIDRALNIREDDFNEELVSGGVKEILLGSKNTAEAASKLYKHLKDNIQDGAETFSAMYAINRIMENAENLSELAETDLSDIEGGADLSASLSGLAGVNQLIKGNKALAQFQDIVATKTAELLGTTTAESLQTADQGTVVKTVSAMEMNPGAATEEQIDTILKQAKSGRIKLSADQTAFLNTMKEVQKTLKDSSKARQKSGESDRAWEKVSAEILTKKLVIDSKDEKKPKLNDTNAVSAADHIRKVVAAVRSGDMTLAQQRMDSFAKFAQSMNNKVDALNRSAANNGKDTTYETVSQDDNRTMGESTFSVFYHGGNARSVQLANVIDGDASNISSIYKALANSFAAQIPNTPKLQEHRLNVQPKAAPASNTSTATTASTATASPSAAQAATKAAPGPNKAKAAPAQPTPTPTPTPSTKGLSDQRKADLSEKVKAYTPEQLDKSIAAYEERAKAGSKPSQDFLNILKAEKKSRKTAKANKPKSTKAEAKTKAKVEAKTEAEVEAEAQKQEPEKTASTQEAETKAQNQEPKETQETPDVEPAGDTTEVSDQDGNTISIPDVALADVAAETKSLSSWFPSLVGATVQKGKEVFNWFVRGYGIRPTNKLPAYFGTSAINWLSDILDNSDELNKNLKGKTTKVLTEERIKALSSDIPFAAGTLAQWMRDGLVAAKKKNPGLFEKHNESDRSNMFAVGKLLNITEVDADGNHSYNEYLLQAAALAAIQWLLGENNRNSVPMDAEDISKILKKPESAITQRELLLFNEGTTIDQAANSLGKKIQQYWGVQENNNVPLNLNADISKAVALELIKQMINHNAVHLNKFVIEIGGVPQTFQNIQPQAIEKNPFAFLNPKAEDYQLSGITDIVDLLVLGEADKPFYLAGETVPENTTQLRKPKGKITAQQQRDIEKAQKTNYRFVPEMVGLLHAFDKDLLAKMLGMGSVPENDNVFDEYRQSQDGRNLAYSQTLIVLNEMLDAATLAGVGLIEAAFNYRFDFSSVNRLQMNGRYNPQASKVMRELVTANESTLDLSNPKSQEYQLFGTALANALGIKVYKNDLKGNTEQAEALLKGDLKPAVEVLSSWFKEKYRASSVMNSDKLGADEMATIQKAFEDAGVEFSMVALHALTTYAKLQNTPEKSRKAFKTQFYMEIDGVTNGPTNSRQIFKSSIYNVRDLLLDRISGMFIGAPNTLDKVRQDPKTNTDLYELGSKEASAAISERWKTSSQTERNIYGALAQLFQQVGEKVTLDEKTGEFSIPRSLIKNPITVILYGAGSSGVAGKLAKTILDGFYKNISEMNDEKSQREYVAAFSKSLVRMGIGTKGLNNVFDKDGYLNPKFTISPVIAKELQDNIQNYLVEFIAAGTWKVLGEDVQRNTSLIQGLTNIQSMVVASRFQQLLNERVEFNRANGFGKQAFVSNKDIDEILTKLEPLMPNIKTQFQNYFIGLSEAADYGSVSSSALDGSLGSRPSVTTPVDIGVKAVPYLNIGSGDGLMIQLLYDMYEKSDFLPVFDGVNFSIENLHEASNAINGAVFETWTSSPITATLDRIRVFHSLLSDEDLLKLQKNPEYKESFARQMESLGDWIGKGKAPFMEVIKTAIEQLGIAALSVDARQQALKKLPVWVHQMAGVPTPFHNKVDPALELELSKMDDTQLVEFINERIREQKTNMLEDWRKARQEALENGNKSVSEKEKTHPFDKGTTTKNGVTTVPSGSLVNSLKATLSGIQDKDTRTLGQFAAKVAAALGYTVHFGSLEDMQKSHPKAQLDADTLGSINLNTKEIFLAFNSLGNLATDTVVHELLHAATAKVIFSVANGTLEKDFPSLSQEEVDAAQDSVARLEKLLSLYESKAISAEDVGVEQAALDDLNGAIEEIRERIRKKDLTREEGRAAILSEFVAWGLSESGLISLGQNITAPSGKWFKTWINKVRDSALKLLVAMGIKKEYLNPGKTAYQNLNFAAYILGSISTKEDPGTGSKQTILQQGRNKRASRKAARTARGGNTGQSTADADADAGGPATYNNPYLDRVIQTFQEALNQYEKHRGQGTDPYDRMVDQARRRADAFHSARDAEELTLAAQHLFPLDPKQQEAFTTVLTALIAQVGHDPASLSQVQNLYEHAMKELGSDSFLPDPKNYTPDEAHASSEMFSMLAGTSALFPKQKVGDAQRGVALPLFVALSMVSPEVRKALSKIAPPKVKNQPIVGMDSLLNTIGENALDMLSSQTLDRGRKSNSVQQSMDNLVERIRANQEHRAAREASVTSSIRDWVDRGNDYLSERISDFGGFLGDHGRNVGSKPSKLRNSYAVAMQAVAGLINQDEGSLVTSTITRVMNEHGVYPAFRDLFNDIVGRTDNNASSYDRIKKVRSAVSALRQQFKRVVPVMLRKLFQVDPGKEGYAAMHIGMGKVDISALAGYMNISQVLDLFKNPNTVSSEIAAHEAEVAALSQGNAPTILKKAKQLATFMNTGVPGSMLRKNAFAIAHAVKESKNDKLVAAIDRLTTLYALDQVDSTTKGRIAEAVKNDSEAMKTIFNYLRGQREEENRKASASPIAKLNHYKGYVPTEAEPGMSLVVRPDSEMASLLAQSYKRVGTYQGSSVDHTKGSMGYYLAPVTAQATFNQGIIQTVRNTVSGVETQTGFTYGNMIAGRITKKSAVRAILSRIGSEKGLESLIPVLDETGEIVAFERSVDPAMANLIGRETDFSQILGTWRGRQAEEVLAIAENGASMGVLHTAWKNASSESKKRDFVNIMDLTQLDDVEKDAIHIIPWEVKELAEDFFGNGNFMVPKEMLKDYIGYRSATIGDAWTGNSRWSQKTQDTIRDVAIAVFGNKAFQYLVNSEKFLQGMVGEAKTLIVVKSVFVPIGNIISNLLQLVSRGVPITDLKNMTPTLLKEIDFYVKQRKKQIELELKLRAAVAQPVMATALKVQIQTIEDSFSRMAIWPLIKAGEFSAISDVNISEEDTQLFEGKFQTYIENLVEKTPPSVRAVGRQFTVAKDTALFRGLEQATQYGDFVAKAIFYMHLTKNKNQTHEEAMSKVTEEFVNYDRLPGRNRGYMESVGLLWFFNYKLRIAKVALAILRENPLHALLSSLVPVPDILSAGTPIDDNILAKAIQGTLGYSTGPGMLFRAPMLNPWMNLAH